MILLKIAFGIAVALAVIVGLLVWLMLRAAGGWNRGSES